MSGNSKFRKVQTSLSCSKRLQQMKRCLVFTAFLSETFHILPYIAQDIVAPPSSYFFSSQTNQYLVSETSLKLIQTSNTISQGRSTSIENHCFHSQKLILKKCSLIPISEDSQQNPSDSNVRNSFWGESQWVQSPQILHSRISEILISEASHQLKDSLWNLHRAVPQRILLYPSLSTRSYIVFFRIWAHGSRIFRAQRFFSASPLNI